MKIAYLLPLVVALAFGFVLSSNVATADDGPIGPEDGWRLPYKTVTGTAHKSVTNYKALAKQRAYDKLDDYDVDEILKEWGEDIGTSMYAWNIQFTYYP